MKCNYPNCRYDAQFTPVVELPTIRSKGIIAPIKPNPNVHIPGLEFSHARYEELLAESKLKSGEMIISKTPTYLLGREVCREHKAKYNFFDWFKLSEWEALREAARAHGCIIPEARLLVIKFMPVGWQPKGGLPLERDRMNPGQY